MKIAKRILGFIVTLALFSVTSSFAQAPANDNFANREVLTGTDITFGGSLVGATIESNEIRSPFYWTVGASGSVWWTWTAPTSTTVVLRFLGPQSMTNRLAVYLAPSLDTLFPIGYTWEPIGRYLRFDAMVGTTYQIQVVGTDLQPFTAQLIATNPPIFIFQPKDSAVSPYDTAIFSAMASGPPPPSLSQPGTAYQWYFNGVALPGQIFPSLLIHHATTDQAGTYSVTASNVGGMTVGGAATLTVIDTNSLPRVIAVPPNSPNLFQFSLTGEPGRWYEIDSTGDLQERDWERWALPKWLQLTNQTSFISIPRFAANQFVRVSLDVPRDVCVAQLKQMRWAAKIWMIENAQSVDAFAGIENIRPYVPLDLHGLPPTCPGNGTYSSYWGITNNPTCTLGLYGGRGHTLTDAQ
jgi:hypothetical protein